MPLRPHDKRRHRSPEQRPEHSSESSGACYLCGHARSERIFSCNGYPIVRCAYCSLAFTDAHDAPAAAGLYPTFDQSESVLVQAFRQALSLLMRGRERFVRRVQPRGRLLDFGCGSGAFARRMRRSGYDVVGLEPFSLGEQVQVERLQLIRGPLEKVESTLGLFDVITLWHVLEHLSAPVETLQRLASHLRPGGAMVVSVPNFRSWQRRVFGASWFHLDAPRHLLHFEPATLNDCLRRAGLFPALEARLSLEYGMSGWVQSSLNELLPQPNYLYEFIKDRGALPRLGRANSLLHLGISLTLGLPLLSLTLPLEALASLAGDGAAITVAARKLI